MGTKALRLAIAALLALTSVGLFHATARPVAADECATNYCATLQIVEMGGPGSGHVTSDPPGIDCAVSASGFAGTCFYRFAWPYVVSSIYVDVTVSADANSYVCMITCSGPGGSIGTSVALSPGDAATLSPKFELAQDNVLHLSEKGTGSGRWTTIPAGIDCRRANGTNSGTCEAHFYSMPGKTVSVQVVADPDAGNYACFRDAGSCHAPDVTDSAGTTWSGLGQFEAAFWKAIPVTISVTGSGHVTGSLAGLSCPSTCSKWLPPFDGIIGDRLVLTATPSAGWHISRWTLQCSSTSYACQLNSVDGTTYEPDPTGNTGLYYNGFTGGAIGVVFEQNATPPPTTAPRPSSKPTSSPTAPSTPAPGSTGVPGPGASAAASLAPDGSSPVEPSDSPTASAAGPVAAVNGSDEPTPVAGVGTGEVAPPVGSGVDLGLLLTIGLLVIVLGVAIGVAVAARRSRRRREA